jgi:hypothetical protein
LILCQFVVYYHYTAWLAISAGSAIVTPATIERWGAGPIPQVAAQSLRPTHDPAGPEGQSVVWVEYSLCGPSDRLEKGVVINYAAA